MVRSQALPRPCLIAWRRSSSPSAPFLACCSAVCRILVAAGRLPANRKRDSLPEIGGTLAEAFEARRQSFWGELAGGRERGLGR